MSCLVSGDTYTPEMVHAAVERGAAWLDEHCPDWIGHINLNRLRLDIQSSCVLGQTAECLTGHPVRSHRYIRVLEHFGKGTNWAETYGFDVPIHQFNSRTCDLHQCNVEAQARYEMLTVAWREYIRQRLQVPA